MATRERLVDRGTRRGRRLLIELGEELRNARLLAGLSQSALARAAGTSAPQISRIEHGEHEAVSLVVLARLYAVVGNDLTARAYPVGNPLRDAAHLRLLERFRGRLSPALGWRTEVPLPLPGDARAWDGVVSGDGWLIGVEAETRLHDLQALERRVALKRRDGAVERVVLVVADTRSNRRVIAAHEPELRRWLPLPGRQALSALASAREPSDSAFVLV